MNPLAKIKYDLVLRPSKWGPFVTLAQDEFVGGSFERYGEYSGVEVKFLQGLLEPGDYVIDAGANMGDLTIPLAQRVGQEGLVIAIEPQAIVHAVLVINAALSGLSNVVALHNAVGEAPGTLQVPSYTYSVYGNYGALGKDQWEKASQGTSVEIITIDALRLMKLNLLKADVEGMELEVLYGAKETIAKFRPFLFLENDREGEKFGKLIEYVESLDYTPYWVITPLMYEGNFFASTENPWPGQCSFNLLCVPNEKDQKMFEFLLRPSKDDVPGKLPWSKVLQDINFE
jgi:FkbM family methyltransferase